MKSVLITGGNKGIGLACTNLFAQNGFRVIVVARDTSSLKNPENVEFVECDLSKPEKVPELAKKVGHVDILVNNAGILHSLPYDTYPEEKKREMLAVNIESPVALIREFSKSMIENGSGRIVNVGSVAGHIGQPDVWYGITKAGVLNMTKSFARILGPKGIVINCVAPGPVDTNMLTSIPEERKQMLKGNSYLKRYAEPEEVAKAVFWLATDCPEYINGITIDINNGSYPR